MRQALRDVPRSASRRAFYAVSVAAPAAMPLALRGLTVRASARCIPRRNFSALSRSALRIAGGRHFFRMAADGHYPLEERGQPIHTRNCAIVGS
jgi:hypothetical protein